jgi:hypothetical protein
MPPIKNYDKQSNNLWRNYEAGVNVKIQERRIDGKYLVKLIPHSPMSEVKEQTLFVDRSFSRAKRKATSWMKSHPNPLQEIHDNIKHERMRYDDN